MKGWLGWTLIAAIAFTVLQMVVGALLAPALPEAPGVLPWWLLSNLLIAAVAVWLARLSPATRMQRIAMLFVVLFGIPANYLAELFIFDLGVPREALLRFYLQDLVVYAALATLIGWPRADQRTPAPRTARPASAWLVRIAVGVAAYIVAYVTAGLAIYPWISDHYAGRHLPGFSVIIPMQAARGLGYVAVAWAIARVTEGTRWQAGVRVGATLAIVGGIAPLIIPSAFLPAFVRHAHIVETGISNFLFGLFVGWLLAPPPSPAQTEHDRFAA